MVSSLKCSNALMFLLFEPQYLVHFLNKKVLILVVLTIIPWPGPTVFKISCPRDNASIVRKLIQKKWIPVLEKYRVTIPVECPFHPVRDIFGPQQAAKHQHRSSQWSCGFCGKSFYEERFLELHFDNIHKKEINVAEDAVCLADYCDVMRCEVLVTQESKNRYLNDPGQINTDIEVWREATVYKTALTLSGPRELVKVFSKNEKVSTGKPTKAAPLSAAPKEERCFKSSAKSANAAKSGDGEVNSTKDTCEKNDLIDSALPPSDKNQQKFQEFQKLKADCKPEELSKLKERCEVLVQSCIGGLLVHLSAQEYAELEEELNRGVCWYLTCDRYWEDSLGDVRPFPWGLVFVFVMVLSLGICFVYYVIWVLFDSKEGSVSSTDASARTTPSRFADSTKQSTRSDEYYLRPSDPADPSQNERYIYVKYPPELKRRLVESCYNRTTKL